MTTSKPNEPKPEAHETGHEGKHDAKQQADGKPSEKMAKQVEAAADAIDKIIYELRVLANSDAPVGSPNHELKLSAAEMVQTVASALPQQLRVFAGRLRAHEEILARLKAEEKPQEAEKGAETPTQKH